MKKIYLTIILLFLIRAFSFSQCAYYASSNVSFLDDYIHDGALTSLQTFPGQSLQINKTVYRGQTYRMAVNAQKELGRVEIKVYDENKQLIYSDNDDEVEKYWDFTVDATLNIIILITCPYASGSKNGCISVLFGFKSDKI